MVFLKVLLRYIVALVAALLIFTIWVVVTGSMGIKNLGGAIPGVVMVVTMIWVAKYIVNRGKKPEYQATMVEEDEETKGEEE